MLRNYLKLALKVLLRRKFFTFISLFGIAFTLVVLTVAAALARPRRSAPHAPETRAGPHARRLHELRDADASTARTATPGYALPRPLRPHPARRRARVALHDPGRRSSRTWTARASSPT